MFSPASLISVGYVLSPNDYLSMSGIPLQRAVVLQIQTLERLALDVGALKTALNYVEVCICLNGLHTAWRVLHAAQEGFPVSRRAFS